MGFRMLTAGIAVVAVALLGGCVPQEPDITPEPGSSSAPVFTSEEEALAAATEAYAKYVAISDLILSEGGKQPERLMTAATGNALQESLIGFESFAANNYHSVGASVINHLSLQQYSTDIGDISLIRVYACLDVSGVDVVDALGNSVVSTARPDQQSVEVSMEIKGPVSQLLVQSVDSWEGRSICGE